MRHIINHQSVRHFHFFCRRRGVNFFHFFSSFWFSPLGVKNGTDKKSSADDLAKKRAKHGGDPVDSEPQRSTWINDRAKKARIQKAAEAKLKKITSQADADDKAAEEAHNQWALHDNLARADPALYGKGLQGLSRAEKIVECKCPKCTNEETPAGFRPISLEEHDVSEV